MAVDGGASITSLAIFSIHGGRLIRLRIPNAPEERDTFAYGGSLAGSYTVNCLDRLLVTQTELTTETDGRTFGVIRALYRASNASFRFVKSRSYRHLTLQAARARFPELRRGASMFSACS